MTRGLVRDLEAHIYVTLRLQGSPDLPIECVVDTGSAGV